MNVQQAPTEMTENRERHSYVRLQGRWLLLARGTWITLVILTLAIFFASLPVFLALLQTPCAGTACAVASSQLSAGQVGVLKEIGLSLGDYAVFTVALTLATMVGCLVVSTVIVWRRSQDRMALLVALMLVTFGPLNATSTIQASPSPWQVPNQCLFFLANALFVLVFLLFPSGRFVPPWMRWTILVLLAGLVPTAFLAPLTLTTPLGWLVVLVFLGELATLVVVQVHRYRRVSSPLERQQTKWVVFGLAVLVTLGFGGEVPPLIFPTLADPHSPSGSLYQLAVGTIISCLGLLLSLSFGFAMLRSRLWEIDVLINRTLVYGALTVILTAVYVGLVIGLQELLRGLISQDNSVAIVLSTLAIAALFQPLRQGIQRIIDRRFYRRKYDAAKIVAAFSATLRNEVDLDDLSRQLVAVVQETMQPTHVSLWLQQHDRQAQQQYGELVTAEKAQSRQPISPISETDIALTEP
jgi:hypothetical protein